MTDSDSSVHGPDPTAGPLVDQPAPADLPTPAALAVPEVSSSAAPYPSPTDPNRYWDGQQWLRWDGAAWVPEAAAPPPYAAPPGRSRRGLVVVGVVVVLLVLAAGALGVSLLNKNKDVTIPNTLGGLSKTTDSSIVNAATQMRTQMAPQANGAKYGVGAYGSAAAGKIAFLVVARGSGDINQLFSGAEAGGLKLSPVTKVGDASCATGTDQAVAVCGRTSNDLVVAVVIAGGDSGTASAMVDQAWNLQ
jgi:hypothetical protein